VRVGDIYRPRAFEDMYEPFLQISAKCRTFGVLFYPTVLG
jgi:hypothetical protein